MKPRRLTSADLDAAKAAAERAPRGSRIVRRLDLHKITHAALAQDVRDHKRAAKARGKEARA